MALIAWQGWELRVPDGCDPVRLEGDYFSGQVLVADMERPRVGVRWGRAGKKGKDAAVRAMREEVGKLAAVEAKEVELGEGWGHGLVFLEPKPPGRDVFVGWSERSGRLVEVVYHAKRRDRVLREQVLPTLIDAEKQGRRRWAVFDLSCETPAGFELVGKRLLAGDLWMTFEKKATRERVGVRQVALAGMALTRQPLENWLAAQQAEGRKWYRAVNGAEPVEVMGMKGVAGKMKRRRRFFFKRSLPGMLQTWAVHDRGRDRLVMVEGSSAGVMEEVVKSMGWVRR